MKFTVLTIFPDLFKPFLDLGLMGRAVKEAKVEVKIKHLRDYAINNQGQLDDTPYGGGSGMVLRPEPAARAIREAKEANKNAKVVLLTPRGETFNHDLAKKLYEEKDLILLCCRYEGVDERVAENFVDYQISIGDFVMMGGELPAMTLMESVSRFIPEVLGNAESLNEESFTSGLLEYPQYTKPQEFEGYNVPEVLRSGNHKSIADWRERKSLEDTKIRRPDLYQKHLASKDSKQQSYFDCPISVALVHYPVMNKEGKVITSSITNLDLHDISRSSRTFGIDQYFLVHPTKAMRRLMETICAHWDVGYGSTYNPNRKEALATARIVPNFEDVILQMEEAYGTCPKIIVTSAKNTNKSLSYLNMKKVLAKTKEPHLIVFGTGWGLADELMDRADYVLEPIRGVGDFNHLSVRAAAAIILDRLLGIWRNRMGMVDEFKAFMLRGNVIDLAVGVIIGGAFGKIVSSLVNDVLMPIVGVIVGGVNFSNLAFTLKEAAGEAPAVVIKYGNFIQSTVDFLIVGTTIFFAVKGMNSLVKKKEEAPAAPPAPTLDQTLLSEIRDLLKK